MWRGGKKPGRRESPAASNEEPATPIRSTPNTFAFAPASSPQSISSPDFNFGRSSDCSPGTAGSWLTKGQASPSEAINPSLLEDMWFGRPSASQTSSAASPGLTPGVSSRTPATADSAGSAPSSSVDRTLDQAAAVLKEQAAQSGSARIPFKPTYHTPADKSQPVPPAPHSTPADAAAAAGASPEVTSAPTAAEADTDVDVPSSKGTADQGAAAAAPGSASKTSPARDQNTAAAAVEPWGHLSPQVLDFGTASKTLSPDSAVSIGSHLGARPDPTQLDFDAVADTPEAATPTLLRRNRSPVSIHSPSELPTPENASPVLPSNAKSAADMSPNQRKELDKLISGLDPETQEAAKVALFGGDASEMTAGLSPYKGVETKETKNWAGKALLGTGLVVLMVVGVFMCRGPPLGFVPSLHNVGPLLQTYSKGMAWEAPAAATGWKKYVHAFKYAVQDFVDPGRAQYSRVEPALAETLQVLRRHNIKLPEDSAPAAEAEGDDTAAAAAAAAAGAVQEQAPPQEVVSDTAPGGDMPAATQDAPAVAPPAATEAADAQPQPAAAPEAAVAEAPVEQAPAAPVQQEQEAAPVEAVPVEPVPAAAQEEVPGLAADIADESTEARPAATGEHEVAPPAAAEEAQQDTPVPVVQEEVPAAEVEEPAAPVAQPTEEPAAAASDAPAQEQAQQPAAPEETPAAATPEQQLDASSAPEAAQPTQEQQAPAEADVPAPEAAQPTEEQQAPAEADVPAPVDTAVLVEPVPEVVPAAPNAADEAPAAAAVEPQAVVPPANVEQQPEQLQAPAASQAAEPEVVEAPAASPADEPPAEAAVEAEEEEPLHLEYVSSAGAEAKPWERAEAVADERLASQSAGDWNIKRSVVQATNLELPLHMWAAMAVAVLVVIASAAFYLLGARDEAIADMASKEGGADAADEEALAATSDLPPTFDQLKAPVDPASLPAKVARRMSAGFGIAKEAISELTGSTINHADDEDDDGTTSQPQRTPPAKKGRGRNSKAAEAAAQGGEHEEVQHEEEPAATSSRGRRKSAATPRGTAKKAPRASGLPAITENAPLAAAAAPALGEAISEGEAEPGAPAPSTRGAGSSRGGRARTSAAAAAAEGPAGSGPASAVSAGRATRGRKSAPVAVEPEALEGNSAHATRRATRKSAV